MNPKMALLFKSTAQITGLLIALTSGITAHAQNFSILANPIDSTVTAPQSDFIMYDVITNQSATDSLQITWKILSASFPDPSWALTGMCDNIICYGANALISSHTTAKFGPGKTCPMIAHFAISTTGMGIVKQSLVTSGQTDTLTWLINYTPTGISTIKIDDSRVAIYPNPATSQNTVFLYADKSLNASKVLVLNVVGQTIMDAGMSSSSELTNLNIASLSKGVYFIKLIDNKGQILTTRKFIKN